MRMHGVHIMKEKMKQNNKLARAFTYTFRYIDDLLTLNNPSFEEEIKHLPTTTRTKKRQQKTTASFPI